MAIPTNFNKAMKKPLLFALGTLVILTGAYFVLFPGVNPLTLIRSKLSPPTPTPGPATAAPEMVAVNDLSKLSIH